MQKPLHTVKVVEREFTSVVILHPLILVAETQGKVFFIAYFQVGVQVLGS